jgi:hypothetical protein
MEQYGECSPRNVGCIEDAQADCKLMVIDANVFLEAEDARIADICAVDEGAEEQEGQNGEDAVGGLVETRSREGKNTNRISSRLSTRRPSTCCPSTLPSLTVALSSFSSLILSLCIASPSPVLNGKRNKSPLNRAEPE